MKLIFKVDNTYYVYGFLIYERDSDTQLFTMINTYY